MLDFIIGKAVTVKQDRVVVQTGGIGYSIKIPVRLSRYINTDEEVQIYTALILKEELIEIYGFLDSSERDLFEKLIKISGIGPTMAINILSTYDRETLLKIIEDEDIKSLSKIPGVGKKTAQRIFLELKGVLPSLKYERDQRYEDLLSALVSLGYKRLEAKEVLEKVYNNEKDEATIIKEALSILTGKDGK
ncbi:Holliday junction DNA helicase RuvA [Thermodesulfovibrio aggregans]|uniref:Holliday junction branch migration complex subunit RuvA n=1 Tax=Thermodesulfovibrio aggregans TaxID=86166 RepID=A0A0U9HWD2_9BACT|nr:Holliday junction branch migration protein RuvA [Thermodesulfovibrio aggregans]GAQ95069.1 Holliday junction DNA helicase RuvA [Thermodesulfovibrio aggregans]